MGYYDDVRDGLIPEDSPIHEQVKQFEKGVGGHLFGGNSMPMTQPQVCIMTTIETDSGITTLNPKYVSAYTHSLVEGDEDWFVLVDIHMVSGTIFTAKMNEVAWNKWKLLNIGE